MRDIKSKKNMFGKGADNFRKIIEEGYYFIDKTMLIKDFVKNSNKILMLPKPTRFGKILNICPVISISFKNMNTKESKRIRVGF